MKSPNDELTTLEAIIAKDKEASSRHRQLTAVLVVLMIAIGCGFTIWSVRQTKVVEGANTQASVAKGEAQKAEIEIQQAQTKVDVGEIVTSGRQRWELGDWDGALREYDKALQIAPGNPPALQAKGYLLFRQNKLDEAIRLLKQSAENDPEYEWAHYNLALAYWKVGNDSAALQEVDQVLKLDPSFYKTFRADYNFRPYIRNSPEFGALLERASKTPR